MTDDEVPKSQKRNTYWAVLIAIALYSHSYAQFAAPASIAPSLIQYTNPYYPNPGTSASRLILYNADGTYVEISSYFGNISGNSTYRPTAGTYTYSIDPLNPYPLNPSHGTIIYDGGAEYDNLYFASVNRGSQVTPNQASPGGQGLPWFTFSPEVISTGGVNVSNRCQLSSGAFAISGFVIQSAGPRWVLLRAVGLR
jgi:hypothetical protein